MITSIRNPKVKALRSLRHRKYRRREGRFLVEGIRIVEEALTCGAPVDSLVVAPDLLISTRAKALVEQVEVERRLILSGDVFRFLSDRDDPQGIAAVVLAQERSLHDLDLSDDLFLIVAYQLRDPGNLGAIIRTADAVGATGMIVVEPSVGLYDPQTIRATMGSLFALPVVRLADGAALAAWFDDVRASGLPLVTVATSAHGDSVHFDVNYCVPLALMIGSERQGLPEQVRQDADAVVRLPMAGRATSLNVSAATAALVYEVVRQRRTNNPWVNSEF